MIDAQLRQHRRFAVAVLRGHDDSMHTAAGELHLAVCGRFGAAARSADGKWYRQSPCAAWNARDVLKRVIGFHGVLLLRPRDDPRRGSALTCHQFRKAFSQDLFEQVPVLGPTASRPARYGLPIKPALSQGFSPASAVIRCGGKCEHGLTRLPGRGWGYAAKHPDRRVGVR